MKLRPYNSALFLLPIDRDGMTEERVLMSPEDLERLRSFLNNLTDEDIKKVLNKTSS